MSSTESPLQSVTLAWKPEVAPVPIADVSDLDSNLDACDAQARQDGEQWLVFMRVDDGDYVFFVGVGADRVPVGWEDHRRDAGPLWTNLSAGDDESDEETFWADDNTESSFPANSLVPAAAAREAARQWFRTGAQPDNITWENS